MFTHFSFPDWHLGVAVMGEYEFYERIVSPIFRDIRNTQGKIIVTFDGDYFHKPFPETDSVTQMGYSIIEELCKISKIKDDFPIRMIRGTNGHDGNMLEYLRPLTKHGEVFKVDTSHKEAEIIKKIKNSKEYAITLHKENDKSLFDDINLLINTHLESIQKQTGQEYNFEIYTKPTLENIFGYNWLFVPEVYDTNDEEVSKLFFDNPDFCIYHGMIEGAIEHYHDDKTSLIYNRSITMKRSYFNQVRYYSVAGHIHTRVSLLPFIRTADMQKIEKNLKLWYGGSVIATSMADAGLKKGYDKIQFNKGQWIINFVQTDSPQFIVFNATAEFVRLDINKLTNYYLQKLSDYSNAYIRLDIDLSYLDEDQRVKLDLFKARFPNLQYKVFNSKEDKEFEDKVRLDNEKLFTKTLKELTIELSDGELSEADYDEFFKE